MINVHTGIYILIKLLTGMQINGGSIMLFLIFCDIHTVTMVDQSIT